MTWLITYTNFGRLQHPKSGLVLCVIHQSLKIKISHTRASLQTSSYHTRKPQVSPDIQSLYFRRVSRVCAYLWCPIRRNMLMNIRWWCSLTICSQSHYCICMHCDSCVLLSVAGVNTKEKPLCKRDTNIVTPRSCSLCCRLWRCGRSGGCFPAKDSSLVWARSS